MIGKELMKNNSERLDYNFIFKPLESTVYYDDGYTYSMAQLELRFSRTEKSKNQIFGGYYAGTLTFACLSLVSFFIHPDMVPGRMGMLIMLYLIQVNTYGSLDAPPKRGFSSIEVKVKLNQKVFLNYIHNKGSAFWKNAMFRNNTFVGSIPSQGNFFFLKSDLT